MDDAVRAGHLTGEDYTATFLPILRKMRDSGRPLRILVVLERFWEGLDAVWEALKADIEFGVFRRSAWERFAIVSDLGWVETTVRVASWLIPGEMRVFPVADLDAAKVWVTGSASPRPAPEGDRATGDEDEAITVEAVEVRDLVVTRAECSPVASRRAVPLCPDQLALTAIGVLVEVTPGKSLGQYLLSTVRYRRVAAISTTAPHGSCDHDDRSDQPTPEQQHHDREVEQAQPPHLCVPSIHFVPPGSYHRSPCSRDDARPRGETTGSGGPNVPNRLPFGHRIAERKPGRPRKRPVRTRHFHWRSETT
jgi:SpoIIAA-like